MRRLYSLVCQTPRRPDQELFCAKSMVHGIWDPDGSQKKTKNNELSRSYFNPAWWRYWELMSRIPPATLLASSPPLAPLTLAVGNSVYDPSPTVMELAAQSSISRVWTRRRDGGALAARDELRVWVRLDDRVGGRVDLSRLLVARRRRGAEVLGREGSLRPGGTSAIISSLVALCARRLGATTSFLSEQLCSSSGALGEVAL